MAVPSSPLEASWGEDAVRGLGVCYLTGLVVVCGVLFGRDFLKPPEGVAPPTGLLDNFMRFDGHQYRRIALEGYTYNPERRSPVAFFPAYPLLGRLTMAASGWPVEVALLAVANVSLAGAFVLLARYVRCRYPQAPPDVRDGVLLSLGLFPMAFFFRMAYSESVFLLLTLAALTAMERRWPLLVIALLAGAATATRPVGVAVAAAFAWHLYHRSTSWGSWAVRLLVLGPLACWGLLAFMAYQYAAFGDPLAFAKNQSHWRMISALADPGKGWTLLSLEPVWGVFDPASPRYWVRHDHHGNPIFSATALNPLLFVGVFLLVLVGAWRRWLNGQEIVLAVGLLAVPYLTRAHEMAMASHGRFAAVVVPAYLVMGRLLAAQPPALRSAFLALAGTIQACFAAQFAAGYFVI